MKYTSAAVLALSLGAVAASFGLYAAEPGVGQRANSRANELSALDRELSARITEMVQAGRSLERQLARRDRFDDAPRAEDTILAGTLPRPVVRPPPPPPAPTVKPAPDAPWWQGLQVSLISSSDKGRFAVINGALTGEGAAVRGAPAGVTVKRVEADAVVLAKGKQEHRVAMRKD